MKQGSSGDNTQLLTLLPLISRTVVSASNMRDFGYTKSQFLIFAALSSHGNLTMSQVAGFISSSKEQATRAVAPLVEDGLVERYTDPANRTHIHIRLTERGIDFMEQYKLRFFQKLQEMMRGKITEAEMLELKNAVEQIIRILTKLNN